MSRRLFLILAAAAALVLATTWPRINDVETGRTPEYPDLRPREYSASEAAVFKQAKDAVSRLPHWSLAGAGSGPTGSEVQAVHATLPGFKDNVTLRIRREAGRSRVSIRSRSRVGSWDFGQNARNIRELQAELDRVLR